VARDTVAALRASVGPDLDDPHLTDLVGELSLKSERFRSLLARHDVREKTHGTKRFADPQVGELVLRYESFAVAGNPGQVLAVYHADPGSPTEQALALLSSIAASGGTPGSAAASSAAGPHPARSPAG
jgi:transcription regulator MmyB-like protein